MKNLKHIIVYALLVVFAFSTSCKKKEEPLILPPEGSFVMDFSDFEDTSSNKSIQSDTTYANAFYSILNVGAWNTVITIGLAVPVASFVESFKHEPELSEDGTWIWSYSFNVGFSTYTAELHGKLNSTKVNWEMYISKTGFGAFSDFLWYKGESNVDNTSGEWTLYDNPTSGKELLGITWSDDNNGTAEIKYMNIVPSGAENGGFIHYGKNTNTNYNAFYDIFNKGLNNHTMIEWNRTSKEGRVQDQNHFNNADWHCWNSQGMDIICE